MANARTSAWTRGLALGTWLSAFPLAVFGGTVTTLRAGMAIDGWWRLDRGHGDYFLLAYPVERWFANSGTFAEHTHRLFGTLVGLLSIALVIAVHALRASRTQVKWAWFGLLAVCAQGTIGGFRVLENSPNLAFLHGVFAQAVLAVLAVNVVLSDADWSAATSSPHAKAGALRHASKLAIAAVFAQIVLGAWLRHTGNDIALIGHIVFAALATGAIVALTRALRATRDPFFERHAKRLLAIVMVQLTLGLLALISIFIVSGGFTSEVSTAETISATAHVLFGALLLQASVATTMWTHRKLALPNSTTETKPAWELEAAR